MPTYEYRCSDCGHQFETHGRIDDAAPTVCERCGGPLRKVFHPAGIVFKGSGFYATDSRAAAKKAGSKEGRDTKSEKKSDTTGAKSEPKSDSKSGDAKESTPSDKGATKKAAGSESS